MLEIKKTCRGFDMAEFMDRYDKPAYLSKSSLATEDCIWLGIEQPKVKILAVDAAKLGISTTETVGWVEYPIPETAFIDSSMHLTREMVADLLPLLQRFVETGELK